MDGAREPVPARPWLPLALGAVGVLVIAGLLVVALGGGDGPDDQAPADDGPAAGDGPATGAGDDGHDEADADRADGVDGPQTSASRGPEGTRELTGVPDEFPPGLLPDDARAIEGTVARGGDDWSAAVVFRSGSERFDLEQRADTTTSAAGFTRRDAIEDRERRVIRYDGEDGSVLTVTLRRDGDDVVVGAVLVSGGI